MSWLDDLHLDGDGSFRDIRFKVKSADRSAGRRTVVHEFPGRDKPMVEDLGKAAGGVALEAFIIGPDYMVDRNKLWEAFNKAGPGKLVHPYWGSMTVTVVGKVRLKETTAEGGMARFTLTVVEGGEDLAPVVTPDTEAAVEDSADTCVTALTEDFEDDFDVAGYIENVINAAVAMVNEAASDLEKIKGNVNAAMNLVDTIGDSIQALADAAEALVLLPGQLADSLHGVILDINSAVATVSSAWDSYYSDAEVAGSTAGTPETAATGATPASGNERAELLLKVFRDSAAFGDDAAAVVETTPQRARESENQTAMIALMRGLSTVESCRAAATIPYASYDQAVAVRDELATALDTLMDTASDVSYSALFDLRADIVTHLTDASAALPRIIAHTPATPLPALVIAHNLYGDSGRETDIIDRNDLRNPCIVNAGEELEVLSDV
jgi:prophage DNA circulation protein